MISQLFGQIVHKDTRYMIVDVGGVGYKVYSPADIMEKASITEPIRIWTHLVVREDALDLYGFTLKDELEFFEMLIGISGIGPKTALTILNLASIPTLKKAIATGDSTYLIKVSGVGKKAADQWAQQYRDAPHTGDSCEGAGPQGLRKSTSHQHVRQRRQHSSACALNEPSQDQWCHPGGRGTEE